MRRVLAAFLTATVIALSGCSPLTPGQQLRKLERSTLVCVDNVSMHSARVELIDSTFGNEHGEMLVRSGKSECEWMQLPAGKVDARIKSVNEPQDVVPPAWHGMRVGNVLRLELRRGGLTPFSFSKRVR